MQPGKDFDESVVLNELLVDEQGRFWMAIDRGVYVWAPTSTPNAKKRGRTRMGIKACMFFKTHTSVISGLWGISC